MELFKLGDNSRTDVCLCYRADLVTPELLQQVTSRLQSAPLDILLEAGYLQPFLEEKGASIFSGVGFTERPDTVSASLMEGKIVLLVDNSPVAAILPARLVDFLSDANDYYFPPLTGTYLRIVRTLILILSVVATPLWYLYLEYAESLPAALLFLVPDDPGALPILMQLLLAEVALDGLKIASMNTPDMLSNSLSIVGALILGDFAVGVGWLCGDVILYMAFVAIANFAQQNHELGYALKFVRVITLVLTAWLGILGFVLGLVIAVLLIVTNKTVVGRRYLYPLLPFDAQALSRLVFRRKKADFEQK